MSQTCSAKTKRGTECRAVVVYGSRFCSLHANPERAAELGRMGGRKNRHYVDADVVNITPPSTPEDVKNALAQAMVDVRARKLDPRTASAITYMAGVLLKAFDSTELHLRIARLEEEMRKKENRP